MSEERKNHQAKGTKPLYLELPEALYDELDAFAASRSTSKKAEAVAGIRRHLAYPPATPPLPDGAKATSDKLNDVPLAELLVYLRDSLVGLGAESSTARTLARVVSEKLQLILKPAKVKRPKGGNP